MKKSIKYIIIISIFVSLIIILFLFFNRDKYGDITFVLNGNNEITIYQGEEYIDPLYRAYDKNNNDLSKYVKVQGEVNTNNIGEYQLFYVLKIDKYEKVLTRKVKVIANYSKYFNINLNGGTEIYHIIDQEYIDKGYYVTDSNGNKRSDIKVTVDNKINVRQIGTYDIVYKITIEGKEKSVIRKVNVYNPNISVQQWPIEETEDNVTINLKIGAEKAFKHVILPDNNITYEKNINFQASDNGIYRFQYVDKNDNKYIKEIEITNITRTYTCTGTVSRYGTSIQFNANYKKNIKEYKWNLDNETKIGSDKYVNARKAYDKASITLAFESGNQKTINCSLKNSLVYKFSEGKPFYTCNAFTAQDKLKYDAMLKEAVNQAGYGTRAGVVEALRFLMGGTGYRLAYDGHHSTYNKVGLNIGSSTAWGCRVDGYIRGMDCTGIFWWPMYQNGVKSVSACSSKNVYPLGEVLDKIKVGDVLVTPDASKKELGCYYAHATIIIGIDENNIYAGSNGVIVIPKNNIPTKGSNTHVRLVTYPNGDGNLTNMWVS